MKTYAFRGFAGCVTQSKSRTTGTRVGVYHQGQAGMAYDQETPWATVCEDHGSDVAHRTLALAKSHMADPSGWCPACQDAQETSR